MRILRSRCPSILKPWKKREEEKAAKGFYIPSNKIALGALLTEISCGSKVASPKDGQPVWLNVSAGGGGGPLKAGAESLLTGAPATGECMKVAAAREARAAERSLGDLIVGVAESLKRVFRRRSCDGGDGVGLVVGGRSFR